MESDPSRLYQRPQTVWLILSNLIPLLGVLFWHWSTFEVVVLYWSENLVIGIFTLLRILMAGSEGIEKKPSDASLPESQGAVTASQETALIGRLILGAFFIFHYGMFTFVHGVFIIALLGKGQTFVPADIGKFLLVLVALTVSHGISFVQGYLLGGERYRTNPITEMIAPYPRIIVLHIAILFGAFLIQAAGSPLPLLILLILGKIILDLKITSHSRKRGSRSQS